GINGYRFINEVASAGKLTGGRADVAINPLKRFVADYEMSAGKHVDPYKAEDNDRKIAVIGGGAEGLSTSYYLARLGYQPTI
ncbi:hypothetical protein Q5L94_14010, partial [Idiomarina sp. Sol25]